MEDAKGMGMRLVLVCAVLALSGCNQGISYQEYVAQTATHDAAMRQHRLVGQVAELKAVRSGQAPKEYKKIVDAELEQRLVDPESRRVEFTRAPMGGLVCGAVNAKNRMGGYTGRQPFYATFGETRQLTDLQIFGDDEIKVARSQGVPGDFGYVQTSLIRQCERGSEELLPDAHATDRSTNRASLCAMPDGSQSYLPPTDCVARSGTPTAGSHLPTDASAPAADCTFPDGRKVSMAIYRCRNAGGQVVIP